MTNINTFFELLVEVCNELPDEFYKELHRGVIVSERTESAPICEEQLDSIDADISALEQRITADRFTDSAFKLSDCEYFFTARKYQYTHHKQQRPSWTEKKIK